MLKIHKILHGEETALVDLSYDVWAAADYSDAVDAEDLKARNVANAGPHRVNHLLLGHLPQ